MRSCLTCRQWATGRQLITDQQGVIDKQWATGKLSNRIVK